MCSGRREEDSRRGGAESLLQGNEGGWGGADVLSEHGVAWERRQGTSSKRAM